MGSEEGRLQAACKYIWLRLDPDPRDLLITYHSGPMTMCPISRRINRPENDDPSLLDRTSELSDVWAPLRSKGRGWELLYVGAKEGEAKE